MLCCLDDCHPEDGLVDRHCKLSEAPDQKLQQEPTLPKRWQGCIPLYLDIFNTVNGSNWFDLTGQGKGKITLQKIIIQFLCKRNKSPLLPCTYPAVSNWPPCQRNCFYDGSRAFIMTTQSINTVQHKVT